jgi:hypothetical protein
MALSTQDPVLAWRRINNSWLNLRPFISFTLLSLKRWLAQQGGNPNLQIVPFGLLSDAETVIADVACKLYGLVLVKQGAATATFSKCTDSATTSSDASSELRFWSNAVGQEDAFTWPAGLAFANGITMQGNTTANGGTTSGANACVGFAIVGGAS